MAIVDEIIHRAIDKSHVSEVGPLTVPRTYGVYRLPSSAGATRRIRYGNHPVRLWELQSEFGRACVLIYLFRARADAKAVAESLNSDQV